MVTILDYIGDGKDMCTFKVCLEEQADVESGDGYAGLFIINLYNSKRIICRENPYRDSEGYWYRFQMLTNDADLYIQDGDIIKGHKYETTKDKPKTDLKRICPITQKDCIFKCGDMNMACLTPGNPFEKFLKPKNKTMYCPATQQPCQCTGCTEGRCMLSPHQYPPPITRISTKPKQGWECPRCHRIHAPWVPSCNCSPSIT